MIKKARNFLFSNRTTRQTIAKNSFWLGFGVIFGRIIRAVLLIFIARVLGTTEFGIFSYALSFAAFFTVFVDLGINGVVVRESSKDTSLQESYFSTGIVIKAIMLVAVGIVMFFIAPFAIKQPEIRSIIPILIILVGLDSFKDFGASLSRAWEKMEMEAGVQIFTNLMITMLSLIALFLFRTSPWIIIGYTLGIFLGMIFAFYPFRKYFPNIKRSFDLNLVKPILTSSWLFGMLNLMSVVQLNTDVIMIGWFRSITDVGYYSAAQKIILMVYILPGVFSVALFPKMLKALDREHLGSIINKSFSLIKAIAIPATLGATILSQGIIVLVYGKEYSPSISSFFIMSLTFLPVYISNILSFAIFSINNEKKFLPYIILGMLGNFIFNLILIPKWGIAGSSLSTLINQIIISIYLYYVVKKSIPNLNIMNNSYKIVVSTISMSIILVILRNIIPTVLNVGVGALVYVLLLTLLNDDSIQETKKIFIKS